MEFILEWEKRLSLIKQGLGSDPKYHDQFDSFNHSIKLTPKIVQQYEEILNIQFPPSFREYLQYYGSLYFYHCQIFGITENIDDQLPNIIFAKRIYQKIGLINHKMIPLSTSADGSLYAIDTSIVATNSENPVIKIDENGKSKVAFENFSKFLIQSLDDALIYAKPRKSKQ